MHGPARLLVLAVTAAALVTSAPLAAQPQVAPARPTAPDEAWHLAAVAMAAFTVTHDVETTTGALGARLAAGRWVHRNLSLLGSVSYLRGAHSYTFDGETSRWTSHNVGAGVGARAWASRVVWAELGLGGTLYDELETQVGGRLDVAIGADLGHRPGVSLEMRVTRSLLQGDRERDMPSVTTVGLGIGVSWH